MGGLLRTFHSFAMGGAPSKNPLGLSDDECSIFRGTFDAFDKDGGGSIDSGELELLLNAFGVRPTPEELEIMIREVDEDGSGEIEFNEFLRMIVLRMERNMMGDKEAILTGFNVFDENKNGVVSASELESTMMKMSEKGTMKVDYKEITEMIKIADKEGIGVVKFEELWGFAEKRILQEKGKLNSV